MRSWEQIEAGLASGEINAAFMDLAHAMYLYDSGLDITMLMFTHRGGSRVIASEAIQKMANFKGKSVLIPHRVSVQHMLVHQLLTARQLKTGDNFNRDHSVELEAVPPALMPELADSDRDADIAAFITPAPFGQNLLETKRFKQLLVSRDLWKDHPGSVFVIKQDLIRNKDTVIPILMKYFFQAARQLEQSMHDNTTAHGNIGAGCAAFLKLQANQVHNTVSTSGVSYSPALLIPDPNILNTVQGYMSTAMEVMPADTDFKGFITPEFAQTAISGL